MDVFSSHLAERPVLLFQEMRHYHCRPPPRFFDPHTRHPFVCYRSCRCRNSFQKVFGGSPKDLNLASRVCVVNDTLKEISTLRFMSTVLVATELDVQLNLNKEKTKSKSISLTEMITRMVWQTMLDKKEMFVAQHKQKQSQRRSWQKKRQSKNIKRKPPKPFRRIVKPVLLFDRISKPERSS